MVKKRSVMIYKILLLWAVFLLTDSARAQDVLKSNAAIKTIVIDAGHGGKDPGCHGASSQEKHVCLTMALMLGEMIKKNHPSINVIYTRDKDVFVGLDERAQIANKNNADLFICIHANAASAAAKGTETFVLGLHKTESQQKIAERENATIYFEEDNGAKYKNFDLSPDAIIARQIQLSVFLDQSISFATKLQGEFSAIGRYDRGVKQAGFLVLYKTTMPSVLIETGFLTNPAEEKFLSTKASQEKMSFAMFMAFEKYKSELEGISYAPSNVTPKYAETEEGKTETTNSSPQIKKSNSSSQTVIFKVQIEASDVHIKLNDPKFKGMKIWEYSQSGIFKYTTGEFENDFAAANKLKNEMRNKGFQHAFVVGFVNGERISIEKAIKLAEK
ncbi:MAG: N-acetylmuramoyl-L-alanine amidase [Lentimonas sp.]|jgi:N-acetylmuramoyl-L-alanine amidase